MRRRSVKISTEQIDTPFLLGVHYILSCFASGIIDQDEEASAYPSFLRSFGNGQG